MMWFTVQQAWTTRQVAAIEPEIGTQVALTTALVDHSITDWLLRLDAATAVLMVLLTIHYAWIAVLERRHGLKDRTLQGIVIIAALTGWLALDLFWVSMLRASILAHVQDPDFVSSPVRLLVPATGLLIGVFAVWWSSEVRRWQIWVGGAITGLMLFYPWPYHRLALWFYAWFTGL